jgi:hypothetical protein
VGHVLTVLTVSVVAVLVVLYVWIVPIRPVVSSLVNEAKAQRESEARARQEAAKAHADLLAALGDLRDEIKAERIAQRVAEVAAKQTERKAARASSGEVKPSPAVVEGSPGEGCSAPRPSSTDAPEGDRETLEISQPPPGCLAESAAPEVEGLGDGDPTRVLSREDTAAAMRGLSNNPVPWKSERGAPRPAIEAPSPEPPRKAIRPPAPSYIRSGRGCADVGSGRGCADVGSGRGCADVGSGRGCADVRTTQELPINLDDLLLESGGEGSTLGPDEATPANGTALPISSRVRNGARGSPLTR